MLLSYPSEEKSFAVKSTGQHDWQVILAAPNFFEAATRALEELFSEENEFSFDLGTFLVCVDLSKIFLDFSVENPDVCEYISRVNTSEALANAGLYEESEIIKKRNTT